jgi:hypothetical protein
MIVEDFIKWLQTQDQGATVEVLCGRMGRSYEGNYYRQIDFDPEKHVDYTDMRGNPFGVGKSYENSRTLFLGDAE